MHDIYNLCGTDIIMNLRNKQGGKKQIQSFVLQAADWLLLRKKTAQLQI